MKNILVIHAHPYPRRSRVNAAMRAAIADLSGVVIHDLYERYPHFLIAVKEEQSALARADIVVLQHPLYWYSCPALLKQWIDDVLELGWAHGEGGHHLKDKHWLQVISTGSPAASYQRQATHTFTITELLRPFEQTARLCGMIPLQPFLIHEAARIPAPELLQKAQAYRQMLEKMTQGVLPETDQFLESSK